MKGCIKRMAKKNGASGQGSADLGFFWCTRTLQIPIIMAFITFLLGTREV